MNPVLAAIALGQGLVIGPETYVPGPAVRLSSLITDETFSRDGRFLTFIDERVEGSYSAERDRIAKNTPSNERAVVRFDLRRGVRQTLYTPGADETLMRLEPMGTGGDILCSIAVGVSQGDLITWRALYCPEGGEPRMVVDGAQARSFHFAASKTDKKAFILICNPDAKASYLYVTETQSLRKELPLSAYQGFFFMRSRSGNPVMALQGPPPDYKVLGYYELVFSTGDALPFTDFDDIEQEEQVEPLVEYSLRERSKGDPELRQSPLSDLLARRPGTQAGDPELLVAQGIIAESSKSTNGLAIVYLSTEGYFLRELVKRRKEN